MGLLEQSTVWPCYEEEDLSEHDLDTEKEPPVLLFHEETTLQTEAWRKSPVLTAYRETAQ